MNLNMPITVLKGIGDKRAVDYNRLGIKTVKDLIEFYPRNYEVSTGFSKLADITSDGTYMSRVTIITSPVSKRIRKLLLTTVTVSDQTGQIQVTWFNQAYLSKQLTVGKEIVIKGKVSHKYGRLQFASPKILTIKDLMYLEDKSVLPIYHQTKGLSQKHIRLAIAQAIDHGNSSYIDYLPDQIKSEYDLEDLLPAINQVHYPDGEEPLEKARRRLIFDEFLLFQLSLMMLRDEQVKIANQFDFTDMMQYNLMENSLPYELTGAQRKVLNEMITDMKGPYNMNRLVQGDVGSGKTIVAALGMMMAIENGYQAAMMAPTEVLAKQHYLSLREIFDPYNIKVGLLVGSMTAKQKRETKEALVIGEIDLIVGTHAVIQDGVEFKDLALVITDEQHRFGVKQREVLAGKGHYPHVLVMSATPIPRTLALILYGDMDVSIIDEMPPGRQAIETYSVNTDYRNRIYQFMLKEIDNGRQCYVVCPKVEEGEDDALTDVVTYSKLLEDALPSHIKIAYLHGKMKPKEKNFIMQEYVDGKLDVIVSTTVIEVGINVPNATIMMIENAERFGLAQLHQLRGRVGRGKHKSFCVLVTDSKTSNCKKRMEIMTHSTDGFVISEKDLELRGHGDLLGVRQSGMPTFKIANVMEDAKILKQANEVAIKLRDQSELLEEEDYKYLKERIDQYINVYMDYIAL